MPTKHERPARRVSQQDIAREANVSRVTVTAGGQPIVSLAGHVRLDGPLSVSEWR